MLNGLDLFSGIGGISLALSPWVRPIAYCENDRYTQAVLLSRMATGALHNAPIWDDVTSLRGAMLPSGVDIIYGGFPCQDISVAGLRRGLAGGQSSLFFQLLRLTDEIKPSFVFIENVGHGIRKFIPTIRNEFQRIGYSCRDGYLSAADIGANHIRSRWWLLAHTNGGDIREQLGGRGWASREETSEHFRPDWWTREPKISRVADGLPHRPHRLRALGNAVVPLQARTAFKILAGLY